ncbi:MAG: hypothetical protein M5T61_12095 [Acidimicrobiia bacterium]|nr:hypothetical protein [Acidimicrobiia bacterium]
MADDVDPVAGHPDLVGAGAAMRADWRSEEEAAGADAVEHWQHGRSLRDRLLECMHRGDSVAAVVAGHRFTGEVVEASDDLLSILTVAGRVDVNLCDAVPVALEVAERARAGGRSGGESSGGFRARLLSRETEGVEVTVGTAFLPEPFDGRIGVGSDHVCVTGRGGGEVFLALSSVAFVAPRRP